MSSIRTGICVLVAFAVLAHGAVEPWSEAVVEIGAAILLLIWAWMAATDSELNMVWNPLLWPFFGFWLVAAFQLATGITAVAFLTRIELLKFSACLLCFFFVCNPTGLAGNGETSCGFCCAWDSRSRCLAFSSILRLTENYTGCENCSMAASPLALT